MRFLFLVAALVAGAFVGWMSVLGGIWFVMPIFLIGAGIVSIAFDKWMRWRVVAFSVGLFAVFAVEASQFVTGVNEQIAIQEVQAKKWGAKAKQKQKQQQVEAGEPSATIPTLPSAN